MQNTVDDKGTTQEQARQILENFCRSGFENDVGKCALVLGKSPEQISDFIGGAEIIDDDLMMKIRGVAEERGIKIE